jgi:hypothetical protein
MKKLLLLFALACASLPVSAQTNTFIPVGGFVNKTASYLALATDVGKVMQMNCSSCTFTLPNPAPYLQWTVWVTNQNASALTVSPNGLALDGSTGSITLGQNTSVMITSDGINYGSVRSLSGLADPGSNGIVKRTAPNTLGIASSSDLIALWTGSCDSTHALFGDGTCKTITNLITSVFGRTGAVVAVAGDYTFDQIGAGSNLNALSMGNGGSLKPVNLGQVAGNQAWLQPGIPTSTQGQFSAVNSGGTIGPAHVIVTQYTLNSTLGEGLPSILFSPNPGTAGCTVGSCTLTMSAPTIPSGYSGWTMYFCDQSGGAGCTNPVRVNACQNIVTSCSITAANLNSGVALPTVNTAIIQPPNVQATECPPAVAPSIFTPDASGNFHTAAGVDFTSTNGQTSGTLEFCRRTWFTDQQLSPVGGNNAFIVMDHSAGVGTATTNQDRTLWLGWQNPANDAATRYGVEDLQAELDFNCNGCTINGSPDAEVTAVSAQLSTAGASTNWTTTGYQTNAIQGRVFRNGAGFDISGINAIYGNVSNNNTTAPAGSQLSAIRAQFDGSVNASNIFGVGVHIVGPSTASKFGRALAIYGSGSLTPAAFGGNVDYFLRNDVHNWNYLLNGQVGLTSIENTDGATQALPINASVNNTGSLTVSQITSGQAAVSSTTCSGGASSYSYQLVFNDGNGGQVTSAVGPGSGNNCTNPLTSGNPATIGFTAAQTLAAFRQAKTVDIYRASGPMGLGKIGTITCNFNLPIFGCNTFSDTGIAATTALPTVNTTGGATIGGDFTLGTSKGQHVNTQAANNDFAGTKTLAAGSGTVTFTRAYANAPVCVATDTTAVNAVQAATSTTALTLTGTSTDVIAYMCAGNPN